MMIHPDPESEVASNNTYLPLKENRGELVKLKRLRILVFSIFVCMVAAIGATCFILIRNSELSTLDRVYVSAGDLVLIRIKKSIEKKLDAVSVINIIFARAIEDGYIGNIPNITLPGFENIMGSICNLASARSVSFNPLITDKTRSGWEAYATSHVDLLQGPDSLKKRINGSWIVADGIYKKSSTGENIPNPGYIAASKYPNTMAPIWQISPIATNAKAIMFDSHSGSTRFAVIDEVISTKQGRFTDLVQLVQDINPRPTTVLYSPITMLDENKTVIGISTATMTWDDALRDALPSYLSGIQCILKTSTQTFTFLLSNGEVTLQGAGDLHDSSLEKYKRIISSSIPSLLEFSAVEYSLVLYPTKELYNQYITDLPLISTISIVCSIILTIILAAAYDYLVTKRGNALFQAAISAEASSSQAQTELEMKRSFVRYISHEIRTPLSTVKMGLELLIADLHHDKNKDELEVIVRDISDSCTTALEVVNDFLLFDKIKSGKLMIELAPRNIKIAIDTAVKPFYVQARYGDIELTVIHDLDPIDLIHNNINVDIHKFQQVLRNTISNALKFTPKHGKVIIKVTKVTEIVNGHCDEYFIIDITDTGAGISKNNQQRLFKEIVQFDAGKLQKGGGSGLGLYISYGIMSQHGGSLSVYSDGEGYGTTFSIKIPVQNENEYEGIAISTDTSHNNNLRRASLTIDSIPEGFPSMSSLRESHPQLQVQVQRPLDVMPVGSVSHSPLAAVTSSKNSVASIHLHMNVLVVDDSLSNRKMLCRILQNLSHVCDQAEDGFEAIDRIRKSLITLTPYDVVVIDYSMPNMIGPEAVRTMRGLGYLGLIIGATGYSDREETEEFLKCGADHVLVKPVETSILKTILMNYVAKR